MATHLATLLDAAGEEYVRLHDLSDIEALHQFRVAIRKVDTFLRSHSKDHPKASAFRHAIKPLLELTNDLRDHDVAIEWLADLEKIPTDHREGIHYLSDRLSKQRSRLVKDDQPKIKRAWKLVLSQYQAVPRSVHTLGHKTLTTALEQHIKSFKKAYQRIDKESNNIHKARIKTKHLRYFLTLFQDELKPSEALVAQLKYLQQALGHIHDCHQFSLLAGKVAKTHIPSSSNDDTEMRLQRSGDLLWISHKAHAEAEAHTTPLLHALSTHELSMLYNALEEMKVAHT